ncbi:hypothetical protein ACFQJD_04345 [Haloplanus sp. GCM10025708]|uniref:hypothetical protein n=1 Tax=Haloferacaceae TaxID=1644056 RepID=UPI003617AC2D
MASEPRAAADPYEICLPDEWTVTVEDPRVVYENGDATVRVVVTEFSRNLTLYWWVDVATRAATDNAWTRRAVGPETTYRDHEAAIDHAEELIHEAANGREFADSPPVASVERSDSAGRGDRRRRDS